MQFLINPFITMPLFYRGIETEHWPEIGLSFNDVFYKKKLLLLKTKFR